MILGTIGSYTAGQGVTLIIDGEDAPTTKSYYILKSYNPTVGDRVMIQEISGTYVVLGQVSKTGGGGGGGGGDAVWGSITGTLSNQSDLQSALNAKQAKLTAGSNISISGSTISASFTETDPVFTASPAHGITAEDIEEWNGKQDKLTAGNNISISSDNVISASFTETDPVFEASPAAGITTEDIAEWDSKLSTITAGNNITISGNTISANKVLVVTVTQSGSDYVMNSTYAAIRNAITTGAAFPILVFNNRYYLATREVNGAYYFVNSQIVPGATFRYFVVYGNEVNLFESTPDQLAWGNITGTLSNQSDLQSALNAKQAKLTAGDGINISGSTITAGSFTSVDKTISSWSSGEATVTDSLITATNQIFITYPASTSAADYEKIKAADIRATAQAAGSITLKALGTAPSSDITITLVIWSEV